MRASSEEAGRLCLNAHQWGRDAKYRPLTDDRTEPAADAVTEARKPARPDPLLLLGLSAAAGVLGALLSGGVGGPLGVLCLSPLAIALVMGPERGKDRLTAAGALLSIAAAATAAIGQLLGVVLQPPSPPPRVRPRGFW